ALSGAKAVAFCGLGNPESFWRSLQNVGIVPIERHSFGDHHRYTPNEVRRLTRHSIGIGAQILLTTAKDAVNLCPEFEGITNPLKVWWLEIGIEIDGREELLSQIRVATKFETLLSGRM